MTGRRLILLVALSMSRWGRHLGLPRLPGPRTGSCPSASVRSYDSSRTGVRGRRSRTSCTSPPTRGAHPRAQCDDEDGARSRAASRRQGTRGRCRPVAPPHAAAGAALAPAQVAEHLAQQRPLERPRRRDGDRDVERELGEARRRACRAVSGAHAAARPAPAGTLGAIARAAWRSIWKPVEQAREVERPHDQRYAAPITAIPTAKPSRPVREHAAGRRRRANDEHGHDAPAPRSAGSRRARGRTRPS